MNFKFVTPIHRRWGGEYARIRCSLWINFFWCFCFWIQNRHIFKQDLVNFKFVSLVHHRWGGEYARLRFSWRMNCFWCFCFEFKIDILSSRPLWISNLWVSYTTDEGVNMQGYDSPSGWIVFGVFVFEFKIDLLSNRTKKISNS